MNNLMKFMMVIVSIAFLAFINAYVSASKYSEDRKKEAVVPKHGVTA